MKRFLLVMAVMAALQMVDVAHSQPKKRTTPRGIFLVDHSKPYVYLEVDHIGPREPERADEPTEGIWLRLHNNCIVPIIVDVFAVSTDNPAGVVGVFDNVVANPAQDFSNVLPPEGPIPPDLAAALGISAAKTSSKPPTSSMPHGYLMGDVISSEALQPGESIYFSIPINQISPKWHVEIPFRFDLKVHSTLSSPHNFLSLYEEDVAAKTTN